jgi:hypothetical protein
MTIPLRHVRQDNLVTDYPAEVCFEIAEQGLAALFARRRFLKITDLNVVCVQPELASSAARRAALCWPCCAIANVIITTLPMVLRDTNTEQRRVMRELIRLLTWLVDDKTHARSLLAQSQAVAAPLQLCADAGYDLEPLPVRYQEQWGVLLR